MRVKGRRMTAAAALEVTNTPSVLSAKYESLSSGEGGDDEQQKRPLMPPLLGPNLPRLRQYRCQLASWPHPNHVYKKSA